MYPLYYQTGGPEQPSIAAWSKGAFLREVRKGCGAQHTTGIMKGGYSHHWPRTVLPRTAYSHSDRREGLSVVDDETPNDGRRDLQDSLIFKCLDHFWLPGDAGLSAADRLNATAVIVVKI
ncbi:hypothetical protein LZ31DRAFT_544837 [Colletotrichum somersetense]|nr:hypothetical protein LZ31DRAFT_544837 [Colletotrichum somersetense]